MQLRIVHTTGYEYDGKAVASYNQARMTPVTTPEQIVVHSRLEVSPKPWTYEYRDYFGTQVTAFEVVDPHESMTVTATSTVQINRPPTPTRRPRPGRQLAEREVADRWTEYLTLPELVAPPDDFAQRAPSGSRAAAPLPGEAARELCCAGRRRGRVPARRRPTCRRPPPTSWEQRAGVCQDMVAPRARRAALGGHPGALRLRLLPPRRRPGRRRDGDRRVARVGRVVGRRLARLRPDQRTASRPTATSRWRPAATTTTSSRCAGSTPGRPPPR